MARIKVRPYYVGVDVNCERLCIVPGERIWRITVREVPRPKLAPRPTKYGNTIKPGKHPQTKHDEQSLAGILAQFAPSEPIDGPIMLGAEFVFSVPAQPAARLKAVGRQEHVPHVAKPDLSNLLKLLEDSLTLAKFWRDDSLVVGYSKAIKRYGLTSKTVITIAECKEKWRDR